MTAPTTTHVTDQQARLPKKIWAVVMKSKTVENSARMKTYIYTHDRKPAATNHFEKAKKNFPDEDINLLEGEITWN